MNEQANPYLSSLDAARKEAEQIKKQLEGFKDLQRRLGQLNEVIPRLEKLAGVGPRQEVSPNGARPPFTTAVAEVLQEAQEPLHVQAIAQRLRERGFKRALPYEKVRVAIVGAAARRPDIRSLGGGRYVYSGTPESPGLFLRPRPKSGTTVDCIIATLQESPGLNSTQIVERVEPMVRSKAKDKRKLVHSVLMYLVKVKRQVRRDPDGRYYLQEGVTTTAA